MAGLTSSPSKPSSSSTPPETLPPPPSSASLSASSPPHPPLSATLRRIFQSLGHNRWLGLITGIWLLACAGSSATFGIYSPALKAIGGYNQQQVQGLAVAKDMGESVGILPGLLSDVLPVWAIVAVGAAHYMAGFSSLFCVATGRWEPLPFWQVRQGGRGKGGREGGREGSIEDRSWVRRIRVSVGSATVCGSTAVKADRWGEGRATGTAVRWVWATPCGMRRGLL